MTSSPSSQPNQSPALKVLIVEDDPNVRLGCEQAMQLAGIPVQAVASAEAGQRLVGPDFPGVVVTDMRLPGMDGMQLLRALVTQDAALPVIMITGHGDVTLAVEAMRSGAYDFIPKPFSPDHLVEVVSRALEKRALTMEVESLRRRLDHRDAIEARLIGRSPQMERVRRLLLELADTSVDVLIVGETGTGKEAVARCLHDLSSRSAANYVALNCGGLPDNLIDSELFGHEAGAFTGAQKRRIGKIEHANGGTLFLDEVESMPVAVQIKLLRVLQERMVERLGSNALIPVACRVVAATKEDLRELADRQKFRADLYYRLNVARVELPPLRERREDIPLLLEHFMLYAAQQHQRPIPEVGREQMQQLMAHAWPGNVRELRNAAECLVLGLSRDFGTTPSPEARGASLAEAVDNFERSLIAAELRRQNGNLARSSEALQVAKTTLHDKIRKYGLAG
ncbi:sigma-54 dependent transcriptional regulator [Azoarcus sp. DN11]|uniref:sigma-54-dependent transcriptional regulator n=1 Tax=Azoarcus sp. DN11 TaxID=356837 RepID=UPI000EAC9D12|nr:sigma-54 dependent transcriptional regulator [Azoarcus sp. DN11]AYH43061.1 Fis family transcriptional regulator [Azoarcus sp. DN11]